MDIISHGLYGGAGFVNTSKKSFWLAVWWGVFPDLIAFGTFFPVFLYKNGFHRQQVMRVEPPTLDIIPQYVHTLYNFSHSLIIFTLVFGLVWLFFRRPIFEMLPWGLHILMDIPSHTDAFFPTPFLYPLSSFHVSGIAWGTPWFFFSYWGILICIYIFMLFRRWRANA
ncbi:MAG: hypothetical protein AAB796_00335 [Patescibacteria group bacterium]